MNYEEQCNKYFAPLDEIAEALTNNDGICGISNTELSRLVESNQHLTADLKLYEPEHYALYSQS